jgi:acetyl-CoA carboxylase biotin carboxyl carrier protein
VAEDPEPTWQDLLDLVTQLTETGYESAAVDFGGISVRLSRTGGLPFDEFGATAPARTAADAGTQRLEAAAESASVDGSAAVDDTAPTIAAPMLGVFYRRPGPGAAPFVEPGQAVEPDTTIGIVEIMKLMNPVAAGVAGVIASFEVEDGTSVQFGQVLARLEPAPR